MLDRWNPFTEISRLQDEIWGTREQNFFRPAVDIQEDEKNILIHTELPGVESKNIEINVEKGVLSVKGSRTLKNEENKKNFHRIERSYGSFSRSFALPEHVDTENIDADLKNGVLVIKLPKIEAEKPRKIEVKSST